MMLSVVVLFCVLQLCFSKMQKVILIDRLDVCDITPNSAIVPVEIVWITINHCTYINSTVDVIRTVDHIKGSGKVIRCANKEQLDSCMHYTTITFDNACPLFNQKGFILSSLMNSYKPPVRCPLQKGRYVKVNGTYNPNMLQLFPLDGWYWKIEISWYDADSNEYFVKMCLEGQVIPYYF